MVTDTSQVVADISQAIQSVTAYEWTESPWPGDLYQQDDQGQVAPWSGYRYSLVPTSTEPMSPVDRSNIPARRDARAVVSTIEIRWSIGTAIDGGARPYHDALAAETTLIQAATARRGVPVRVEWLRSARTVQDTGWVVGTITIQAHHEISMGVA